MAASKPKRIFFLLRAARSDWGAVDIVSPLLEQIYLGWQSPDTKVRALVFSQKNMAVNLATIAIAAWKSKAEIHVVSLDYNLSYFALARWAKSLNYPRLFLHLHLYGDIAIRKRELFLAKKNLDLKKTNFFVASRAVKNILGDIFPPSRIRVIGLPIRDLYWKNRPGPAGASASHRPLRLAYVGRMSVDKGVAELLLWWSKHRPARASLLMIGDFEDYQYYSPTKAKEWQKRRRLILGFHQKPPEGVQFRKAIPANKLVKLLHNADYLISFSTFPLEELGVALVEGTACGTGLIVSDWMGHKTFSHAPHSFLIPVLGKKSKTIDSSSLNAHLRSLLPLNRRERNKQHAWTKKYFTSKAIDRKIKSVIMGRTKKKTKI